MIRRNLSKRKIVYSLYNRETVAGFPYEIYYFSRNMEHVLHDKAEDLTDDEKEDLAFDIADQYTDQPEKFLEYLYDDGFHVCGTYKDTWEFIMDGNHSLNRYCNVAVFFEQLGIGLEKYRELTKNFNVKSSTVRYNNITCFFSFGSCFDSSQIFLKKFDFQVRVFRFFCTYLRERTL